MSPRLPKPVLDLPETVATKARTLLGNKHQGPLQNLGMAVSDLENFAALPLIRRSRDFHLYSQSGKRYLDLYRGDGTQILGHSVAGLGQMVKQRLDQGGFHGLPHQSHFQLPKMLARVFPGHRSVICPDRYRIRTVLELLGVDAGRPMIPHRTDLTGASRKGSYSFWLPFSAGPADIALALLPAMSLQGPYVLLVENHHFDRVIQAAGKEARDLETFLRVMGQQAAPWSLVPVIKGLAVLENLGAFAGQGLSLAGAGGLPGRHKEGLGLWRESAWLRYRHSSRWQRTGPYLVHDLDSLEYSAFFRLALARGVVMNPRSDGLNILPGTCSEGERQLLCALLEGEMDGR